MEPRKLGVLDPPPARGMTTKGERYGLSHCKRSELRFPYAITSNTSSIVISTGLSPRLSRPSARPPV